MTADIALYVLAAVLVVVGFAGVVFPALPGAVFVFAGLVLAAWTDDFAHVGPVTIAGIGVLGALTYAVDLAATAFGAKRFGASKRAVVGAAIGTIAGLFFGIPGILLGPFVGAVIGEYTAHGRLEQAGRAGVGAWLGLAIGAAAKVALVFAMVGVFALAWGIG